MNATDFAVRLWQIRQQGAARRELEAEKSSQLNCKGCVKKASHIAVLLDSYLNRNDDDFWEKEAIIWKKFGWKEYQSGSHARTFICPHGQLLARSTLTWTQDKGYNLHAKNCMKYPDNPYFQKIYLHQKRRRRKGYLTVMEYLDPIESKEVLSRWLVLWRRIYDAAKKEDAGLQDLQDIDDPELLEWVEVFSAALKKDGMHSYPVFKVENARMRGDQLVFIDPLY